jgi:hypothetical protein
MAGQSIGTGRCPIGCGSHKARYTVSKSLLAVGTCNTCNTQVFARSDRSDEVLRANITHDAEGKPVSGKAPAPAVDKAPASPAAAPPARAEPPGEGEPPAPPKKRVIGWGILAGQEA